MPTLEPQPSQDTSRMVLVLILLFWLMVTPDNSQVINFGPGFASMRLQRQRDAHGIMNTTQWGDFAPRLASDPPDADARYLNMTGFRQADGYAWEDLGRFRDRCHEWSRNAFSSEDWNRPGPNQVMWGNATGRMHGEWVRRPGTNERLASGYNLSAIAPEVNWVGGHEDWQRNVTGGYGRVALVLEEYEGEGGYVEETGDKDARGPGSAVRQVSAGVEVQDKGNASMSWAMRLYGLHWPRQGAILLTTSSDKFHGIFGLPHLAPGPEFFQSGQKLLNITLDKVLREPAEEVWEKPPRCEYIVYAQLFPLDPRQMRVNNYRGHATDGLGGLVAEMERELRFPTGAPFAASPDLRMSMVAWSPDCGYFLESKGPPDFASADGQHLVGVKEEVFIYEVKSWVLALAVVYFVQVWLLKGQLKETNTPSTLGRVSFYTACAMLLADGIIFSAAIVLGLSLTDSWLAGTMVFFATFLSMTMGGAFLSDIFRAQEVERESRWRARNRGQNTAAAATATPAPPTAPSAAPPTASPPRPPSPPIIIPSDQDIDAEIAEIAALPQPATTTATARSIPEPASFSSLIGRLIFLGLVLLFLSVSVTAWPAPARAAYVNLLAAAYLSLWVPQIWHSFMRNSRRAFSWRFLAGQSALRLAPFAHFYLREDNLLFADPDGMAFAALAGWLWFQLCVLAAQDVLGPRFGVQWGAWAPEVWDYHPVVREGGLEAGGLPIGLERKAGRVWATDCAICFEVLEVPVEVDSGVGGVLARRQYMVTPCRHIFHTKCLEEALRVRLQCPICRDELPPL